MSFSNNSISRPVTPPPRPTTPPPESLELPKTESSVTVEPKPVSKPEAFKGLEPKTTSSVPDESNIVQGEGGIEKTSSSKLVARSQQLPEVSGLSQSREVSKVEIAQTLSVDPIPQAPPQPHKPFTRSEFGKLLIAPHFFANVRELEQTYFFKKPVFKRAMAKAAEISRQLMKSEDFRMTMVGKSDDELREMVAHGIALTKSKKYGGDTTYAQLSENKRKLVDAIVAGLKQGMTPQLKAARENVIGGADPSLALDRSGLKDQLVAQRTQLKSTGMTLEQLEEMRQKSFVELSKDLRKQNDDLRSEVSYRNLPVPDPKDVNLIVLGDQRIKALGQAGGQLNTEAEKLLREYSGSDKQDLLMSISMRPFDTLVKDVTARMFFTPNPSLGQREQAQKVALALLQAAMKEIGSSSGNHLVKSDGEGNPEQVTVKGKAFTMVRKLGEGGFGRAFLFRSQDGEEVVVKKFMNKGDDEERWFGNMQKEIRAHRYAMGKDGQGHENVLGLKGVVVRPPGQGETFGEFFTVTEVAKGGELRDLMGKLEQQLRDKRISKEVYQLLNRQLFAQIVDGMLYVQRDRQMLHMDLKPENVFMTLDGTVKVADFGLSYIGHKPDNVGGTPDYMSPEIGSLFLGKQGRTVDFHTDTWTLGLMGKELFSGNKILDTTRQRAPGEIDAPDPLQDGVDFAKKIDNQVFVSKLDSNKPTLVDGNKVELQNLGSFEKLMNAMLHPDPSRRPTLEAVKQHDFVSDPMLQSENLQALLKQLMTPTKDMSKEQLKLHNQEIARLNEEVLKEARH